jgi:hypothetical protein
VQRGKPVADPEPQLHRTGQMATIPIVMWVSSQPRIGQY